MDVWKRTERKLQSFDKKKTKSKMNPKIPLEKNKEKKNRKSEEKENKKEWLHY